MELTIIISVFNGERTIKRTLDSVIKAYNNKDVKIIVANDASTDDTVNILSSYEEKFDNLEVINFEENVRPGIARNKAIEMVDTEYFMILDADDEVRKTIFSELENYVDKEYDVIKFNHMYSKEGNIILEKEPEYEVGLKQGVEIEELAKDNFYSWGRIFRTKFIKENNIKFSEKIYYEDINFVVGAYTHAKKAFVLPNILLQVNIEEDSATRQVFSSDFHIESLNQAVIQTFENNEFQNIEVKRNVWRSLASKGIKYLESKCPEELQDSSSERLFSSLRKYVEGCESNVIECGYDKIDLIASGKAKVYSDLEKYSSEPMKITKEILNKRISSIKSKRFQKKIQAKYNIDTNYAYVKYFEDNTIEEKEIIVFLGFDFDLKGNSKYKFIETVNQEDKEIYYITKDTRVNEKFRIEPYSLEYYYVLAHAEKVYLESYTDLKFTVGENTEVIQLWHGTPIKKLLLDSNEKQFRKKGGYHKKSKLNLIEKYDEFYVYNQFEKEKLQSAFNLRDSQIKESRSPRISYLKKQKNESDKLKEKYDIPTDKKVLAYTPTWKDYSYDLPKNDFGLGKGFFYKLREEGKEEIYQVLYYKMVKEFEKTNNLELYLRLDIIESNNLKTVPTLEEMLEIEDFYYNIFSYKFIKHNGYKNGNYYVIFKPHDFKSDNKIKPFVDATFSKVETQDIILCTDVCISDYSSIIFDYMEIDKPVYLLWDDYTLYQEYRGIYAEIEKDFDNIIATSDVELYELLKSDIKYEKLNKYINLYKEEKK